MSAFQEAPDHFVAWLAAAGEADAQAQFVRRQRYGDYLQAMIQAAVANAAAGRLLLEPDAAVSLRPDRAGWRVGLAMGRSFHANAVVLAIGNLAPREPPGFTPEALASEAYIGDPWSLNPDRLPLDGEALLVGAGLSMVDVALQLHRVRPRLRMSALSRRGLLPRRHLTEGPAPLSRPPPDNVGVLDLLRILRRDAQSHDWRAVLDGVRPHVHALWRGWSFSQRQRFLRHARPWWDVHRHRLSPPVAARLDHLMAAGHLSVSAGRLKAVEPLGEGLRVRWSRRGGRAEEVMDVAVAINCAGPSGDPERTDDPLLVGLLSAGLIRPDSCRLGVDVDETNRLIGRDGRAAASLFALGPITRGSVWEITSVPDIRVQARACANAAARAAADPETHAAWVLATDRGLKADPGPRVVDAAARSRFV
jgi:uncharacterized NAD(P)/FAD-binding protein YdhS